MAPGTKLLVTGITLFILGMIVITMVMPILLYDLIDNRNGEQFKVPGITQVTVEEPGHYYLWNDYHTVFEGKSYTRSDTLPDGMEFKIRNQATGKLFNFVTDLSISSNRGMSSSNSIGYVDVTAPQKIEIEVIGGAEDRIFSFSRSIFTIRLGLIFCGSLLSMAISFIGFGLFIWGVIKRFNSTKNEDKANSDQTKH